MSLDRLADIELQLCMHGMLALERLQFARCSRQLLHAAQSPFAWKHVQPLSVKTTALSSPSLAVMAAASFLRHIPLELQWTPDRSCVLPQSTLDGLDALHRAGVQVHSLDSSRCRGFQPPILRALLHPLMGNLRMLRLPERSARGVLPLVAQSMPHLHTLHMPQAVELQMDLSDSPAELFQSMHALTYLHVNAGSNWMLHEQLLDAVQCCPSLTHLGLVQPHKLHGPTFGSYFAGCANLRRLQSLTLQMFNAAVTDAGRLPDYATAFAAMDQLRAVELIDVNSPDAVLAQLHHATSLRVVTLRCAASGGGLMHPTPPVVASMLSRSPLLRFNFVLVCAKVAHKQVAIGLQRRWQQLPLLRDARKNGKRIVVAIEEEQS